MAALLNRKFGAHVRCLRTSRSLTQESLAESSGLSVDSIRRIERGTFSPTLDTLAKLADGLELSLPALFSPLDRERGPALTELMHYLAAKSDRDVRAALRIVRQMLDAKEVARGD